MKTHKMVIDVFKTYGFLLKFVPEALQQEDVCTYAISQNKNAFRFVIYKTPTLSSIVSAMSSINLNGDNYAATEQK